MMFRVSFHLMNRLSALPFYLHAALAVLVVLAFRTAKAVLEASYAASGFPVDYMTGQTAFSGALLKGYYADMQAMGTLGVYWQTQFIDFVFIASVMAMGIVLGAMVARSGPRDGLARKVGFWAGVVTVLGATFDICENLLSFVLLSDPAGFPDVLALPYSASAVAKFACLTLGMGLALGAVLIGLGERGLKAVRPA